MKALMFNGAFDVVPMEIETPEPAENEVRIRVKAVSICGSDISGYRGKNPLRVPPLVMGHEFSGVIDSVGGNVQGLKPGMRATVNPSLFCGKCENCRQGRVNLCDKKTVLGTSVSGINVQGAMSEYICVRASNVIRLPDTISFEEAALLEPMAVSLHGVKHGGEIKGKNIAVVGSGPIGLFAMQCIRERGAKRIVALDLVDSRLEKAKECGATHMVNLRESEKLDYIREIMDGIGADVVYDCVGSEKSVEQDMCIVRNGGKIVVIGMAAADINFSIKKFVLHEFNMVGSYQYVNEMEESIELIAQKHVNPFCVVTSVMPLEEGVGAFNAICAPNSTDIKIVLNV